MRSNETSKISVDSLLNTQEISQETSQRRITPDNPLHIYMTMYSQQDNAGESRYLRNGNRNLRPDTVSLLPTLPPISLSSNEYLTTNNRASARGNRNHHYTPYNQPSSPHPSRTPRQQRPQYSPEEAYFIWYNRCDLQLDWPLITRRFNGRFERKREGPQGFQCKFYRFLHKHGLPSVRTQNKTPDALQQYTLRTWIPELWFPWMVPGGESFSIDRSRNTADMF